MDLAIGIYHAGARIVAHPGRAYVVPGAVREIRPAGVIGVLQEVHHLQAPHTRRAELAADEFVHGADTSSL